MGNTEFPEEIYRYQEQQREERQKPILPGTPIQKILKRPVLYKGKGHEQRGDP